MATNQIARLACNHGDNLNRPVRMSNVIRFNAIKYMSVSGGLTFGGLYALSNLSSAVVFAGIRFALRYSRANRSQTRLGPLPQTRQAEALTIRRMSCRKS